MLEDSLKPIKFNKDNRSMSCLIFRILFFYLIKTGGKWRKGVMKSLLSCCFVKTTKKFFPYTTPDKVKILSSTTSIKETETSL